MVLLIKALSKYTLENFENFQVGGGKKSLTSMTPSDKLAGKPLFMRV